MIPEPENPVVLTVVRRYPVTPERVFDAWLDPQTAARFLFATETGEMVRNEIDARVGGGFVFTDRRDGQDVEHVGEYLAIERPHRLVFTFHVKGASEGDFSRVTLSLRPDGDGTELTLTHEMDPKWADYADRTRTGWGMILEGLATALS